jgi:hypothetical protein
LRNDNGRDDGGGHLLALSGREIRSEVRVGGGNFPHGRDSGIHGLTYGGDNLIG